MKIDDGLLLPLLQPKVPAACPITFQEMYDYNSAGQPVGKRLRSTRWVPYTITSYNLDSAYTYDNEGRMTATQYPLSGTALPGLRDQTWEIPSTPWGVCKSSPILRHPDRHHLECDLQSRRGNC